MQLIISDRHLLCMNKSYILSGIVGALLGITFNVNAQTNLLVNGDFSMGNIGFTSGQIYGPYYSPCYYYVAPTFFTHPDTTLIDHTPTSDGMYMSIDGCSPATILWEQSVPVIQTNCNYNFSFWATRADYIAPVFEIHMIGDVTGDDIVGYLYDILYTGTWTWDQYSIPVWNSGANTTVTIRVINVETNPAGNDFGLDDFSFKGECAGANAIADAENTVYNVHLFPNPVSESFSVFYTLTEKATVKAELISIEGKIVSTVFTGNENPGEQKININLDAAVSKGIYFLRLTANKMVTFQKVIVQ